MDDASPLNCSLSECCDKTLQDSIALATLEAETTLRNRALTLSTIIAVMMYSSHIIFAYIGKPITVPEIAWAIVLAPWFGATGGKVLGLLDRKNK